MKRVLAAVIAALIILFAVLSVTGAGAFKPVQERLKLGLDFKGGVTVVMEAQSDATGAELAELMEQTQHVIENRVNQMGLSEPVVTIEGERRIRIELPGAEDADEAIRTIGKTAQLLFVTGDGNIVLDGSMVRNAGVTQDEMGFPAVSLEFDGEGTTAFAAATEAAYSGKIINAQTGAVDRVIYIILDNEIISNPQVNSVIANGRAIISGNFTSDSAVELARLIRAGALPVDLKEIETSVVGPSLGINSLSSSVTAGVIGVGLVLLLMLIAYYLMGLVADFALVLYVTITFWILALFSAVLNLPGIAGIVLGIGMAVDANVIIFSRIREEYQEGKTVRVAVQSGFKRAFVTVIDAQVTTLIAGVVLYALGTGAVRGFALTLMISIFVSVFTAVIVSRLLVKGVAEGKISPKILGVETKVLVPKVEWIRLRKYFYIAAVAFIVLGCAVGLIRGFNYGVDFSGGTRIQLDMHEVVSVEDVQAVLRANGIDGTVVHSGSENKQIIIKTTAALENEARQSLIASFGEAFGISDEDILEIEHFSASVGAMLKRNAVKAVLIASVCMLVYIIVRFEWMMGVGAIVALIHDVLFVFAVYGLFHVPVNNPFIAGILTVVGYSINDTIVVFDRIREHRKADEKRNLEDTVNLSINQTLTRSIMTSVTTIVAIVPLLIMGGTTITEFCIPLLVGVLAGTISSITIASPVYYELASRMKKNKYHGAKSKKKKASPARRKDMDGAVV
jgi:SecD/SecF fusion protein